MSDSVERPTKVVVLGSTGSIGQSTMDVLWHHKARFEVVGLAAGSNAELFAEQVARFRPGFVALAHGPIDPLGAKVVDTADPLATLATLDDVDIIVVATSGHIAIRATLAALEHGKTVALANKEVIVSAGHLAVDAASRGGGVIRPVDSEHSAIWQSLEPGAIGSRQVRRIILTASGGPFRDRALEDLRDVTPSEALAHPTWSMGARISIDSATLMNKGFELIETSWLFDCPIDMVDVLIHPQSIVHSMVEYNDGSIIAQLGSQDMRVPVQYALTYPDHLDGPGRHLTIADLARLSFQEPDERRFPALGLAREAARNGGTYPTVLSTADEILVTAFLAGRIPFTDIIDECERLLAEHRPGTQSPDLDEILTVDAQIRASLTQLTATP